MAKQINNLSGFNFSEANLKITPDFDEIKRFDNDPIVNELRFRKLFEGLMNRNKYLLFIAFLNQYSLSSDHNLYFFWVHLTECDEHYRWAKETENYKIWNTYNKDLKLLKEEFAIIEESYEAYLEPKEKYFFHSIVFNLNTPDNKPKKIKITAHPLMFDIFFQLNDFIKEKKNKRINPVNHIAQYFKQFIYETIPFFEYLKASHFKSKHNTIIYEFISGFLETIGIKWHENLKSGELPEQYIKARYNEFKRQNKRPIQ